ncbi:ROK family transcriptional regulator [Galactobacter sp.]|uniref:ROK family transcriptional regulator n=1 Tax=Galactobacter sp. TaxID=2676125 RepID=UPI0025BDA9BF|nr:ROK family transcriptional regulator [Galactobacter sp.]
MGTNSGARPSRGNAQEHLRRANAATVLKEIFLHPGQSRREIAEATGLSAATLTPVALRLIGSGLVMEGAPVSTGQGRPRIPLRIDPQGPLSLGIHLGPRISGVVLTDLLGAEVASVLVAHEGDASQTLGLIADAADVLLAQHAEGRVILGTGVASGGIVDGPAGVIKENRGADWTEVPVVDLLSDRLPGPILVDHNTRAAAQYELLYGHGRDTPDFLLIVSTADLGAVLVDHGRIRHGAHSFAGGLDHLRVGGPDLPCACGSSGCLVTVGQDDAVVQRCIDAGVHGVRNYDDVERLDELGEPTVRRIVDERDAALGVAATVLGEMLDPALIVVFGTPVEVPRHLPVIREAARESGRSGADVAARITASTDHRLSLSIVAASLVVARLLEDPLGLVTFA